VRVNKYKFKHKYRPNEYKKHYDAIIIGAGSIGLPTALSLAEAGESVLVIDKEASVGQGENKRAIGGVRATHSYTSKIVTALRSLEIVSTWKQLYGDDIEWMKGGYLFVVYRDEDAKNLKNLLTVQKSYGLNIDWLDREEVAEIIPGINQDGLLGGTYSPNDGNLSPLLLINAYARRCLELGVDLRFKEAVTGIQVDHGAVSGVRTNKNTYKSNIVINAAGAYAKDIATLANIDIPIRPAGHEAGITEPVKQFCNPMVVDMRPQRNSKNYYFHQNVHGQILFCITPEPPVLGNDIRSTSAFLPQIAPRMIDLVPRLKYIKVRRCWRGIYPMTPDGEPLVGETIDLKGFIIAGGMCGQGVMLGPGIGELVGRFAIGKLTQLDVRVLKDFSLERNFSKAEVLE